MSISYVADAYMKKASQKWVSAKILSVLTTEWPLVKRNRPFDDETKSRKEKYAEANISRTSLYLDFRSIVLSIFSKSLMARLMTFSSNQIFSWSSSPHAIRDSQISHLWPLTPCYRIQCDYLSRMHRRRWTLYRILIEPYGEKENLPLKAQKLYKCMWLIFGHP
ncbi:hypothetical protein ACTXT7_015782, partial [Hymenolepis weldensis]